MPASSSPKLYLYKRLVSAKLFIDAHYADRIDIGNIAGEACFSKFHFIRLFSEAYGKTPHHYLTQVRINKAKLLLAEGVPVAHACVTVGFESSTSFAAVFKKQTGISPSVYRRRQLLKRVMHRQSPLSAVPNCFAETFGWTKNAISESY